MRSATVSQGFEQSSWRLTCGDLVARVPPRERERGERERVSKRASEQAAERASERASERDRVAQGRRSESGTLSRRAAAAGLAPDVKFSCGKSSALFHSLILIGPDYRFARWRVRADRMTPRWRGTWTRRGGLRQPGRGRQRRMAAAAVGKLLGAAKQTVSVAESSSGGIISARLLAVPGA